MYAPAPELSADQVLQAFHHDGLNLFFGAMIMAVGLVVAAFSSIRRKHDPILIYLAFLAGLYGLRMWVKTDLPHSAWIVVVSKTQFRDRLCRSYSLIFFPRRRWFPAPPL